MSQRKKYLAKNTALFALNSIGSRIITFLLVPLYTSVFTSGEYGTFDVITAISTVLVPVITINIGEAVMRFSLDRDADKNGIVSIGLFFSAVSFVLGSLAFLVMRFFPQVDVNPWFVYAYCVTQGLYVTFACNLRGQEKLFHYAMGNILHTFFAAVFNIIFLVYFRWGIPGYFYAYILANILTFLYCFVTGSVINVFSNFHLDQKLMKEMAKYAIMFVPHSLMWWIMNSSDHVMVTAMISLSANGIYAISYKIPSILSSLSTVFNQAWSYSAIHENESEDREAFNNNMYGRLTKFLLLVTSFLMCVIKPFLQFYVPQPEYAEAWLYTPYLLVGYFFLTVGTFLSIIYNVNKDSRGFMFSGVIGAVLNIVMNFLFIPRIGVHGAALATCVSYIVVFLYTAWDTRKFMVVHVEKPEYVIGYFVLILSACSMYFQNIPGHLFRIAVFVFFLFFYRSFVKECLDLALRIVKRRKA
ncbi:MAG TPA: flippase [Erysipelotrichaceae bacterium]|nr:flippase [Erysipelotrichaceae bacterium]